MLFACLAILSIHNHGGLVPVNSIDSMDSYLKVSPSMDILSNNTADISPLPRILCSS